MDRASQIVTTFLGNALWQIPLMALATACCDKLGRRRFLPARRRHLLWVVALVLSVGLPLLSPRYARESGELYFSFVGSAGSLSNAARTVPALVAWLLRFISEHPGPILMSGPLTELIAYLYAVFLLYRLGRFCGACLRTRIIRRRATAKIVPEMFVALMQRTRQDLGVFREPALHVSPQDGPMTCGVRNPVIILPEALLAETSPIVITSVLGHELAHVRRYDFLLNLVYEFLFLPISFHPAAWFLKQKLEQTRELACDEMVAGPLLDPLCYAQSLFSVIQSLSLSRVRGCGLEIADTRKLEERFKAILSSKPRDRSAIAILFMWLIILGTASIAAASFAVSVVPVEPESLSASAVSILHARDIATRFQPGEIVGEEISRKKTGLLYSFYIRTQTGITEVYIKAASGEVASVIHIQHPHDEIER